MSTEEGNRLIADFMGAIYVPAFEDKRRFVAKSASDIAPADESYGEGYKINGGYVSVEDLKYHTSWDWLMPVVEKIPTLNPNKGRLWFEYEISRCHCRIYTNINEEWKNNGGTTLEATFKTIIDFITWYNSITPETVK